MRRCNVPDHRLLHAASASGRLALDPAHRVRGARVDGIGVDPREPAAGAPLPDPQRPLVHRATGAGRRPAVLRARHAIPGRAGAGAIAAGGGRQLPRLRTRAAATVSVLEAAALVRLVRLFPVHLAAAVLQGNDLVWTASGGGAEPGAGGGRDDVLCI